MSRFSSGSHKLLTVLTNPSFLYAQYNVVFIFVKIAIDLNIAEILLPGRLSNNKKSITILIKSLHFTHLNDVNDTIS
jgi:hypothetical protein